MSELFAREVLEGLLGPGKVILNDYVMNVLEIEGGHQLVISRGNDVQTLDVLDGPQGEKGDTGEIGPQGEKGEKGPYYTPHLRSDGRLAWTRSSSELTELPLSDSLIGPQGEKGDTGETGATGPQGPAGETGPAGPQGEKGDTGDVGPQGPQGETGPQGPKGEDGVLTFEELTEEQKESLRGPQGEKGDAGAAGEDGGYYTPTLNTDGTLSWTPSKDGMPVPVSTTSLKGPSGFSPTIGITYKAATATTPKMTRLTITTASGTDTVDIYDGAAGADGAQGPQGEKGDAGEAGPAGYTPVKGTDYYTEADKAEMVKAVLAALPAAEGGSF